jgi:DNA helicase-2/ATP-dependent DNA helicase PcrA
MAAPRKKKAPKPEPQKLVDMLTTAQRAIVQHREGPLLAGAVAGSGKSSCMVERVAHLVQHGVLLSRICIVAFNVSAAEDLNRKLKKRLKGVPGVDLSAHPARTLHSLALMVFKSDDENEATRVGNVEPFWTKAIREAHAALGITDADVDLVKEFSSKVRNDYLPSPDFVGDFDIRKLHSDLVAAADATIESKKAPKLSLAQLLEVFCKADRARRAGRVTGTDGFAFATFDDILWEAARIMEHNAGLRDVWQRRYDHVIVDEAQDLCEAQWQLIELIAAGHRNLVVVGDVAQCVAAGTLVSTPTDARRIEDLASGDVILAFRNGHNRPQRVDKSWSTGLRRCVTINTKSGHRLTMSVDHRLWTTTPDIRRPGEMLVYMMYRSGFGFRIGITNRAMNSAQNQWGNRLNSEGAERLWIVAYGQDREDALFRETSLSLTYAIPTALFNAAHRGLNQERVDAIFAAFGENGRRLLADLDLSFDYPHWMSGSTSGLRTAKIVSRSTRRVVRVTSHGPKGTGVRLEWSGGREVDIKGLGVNIRPAKKGGNVILKLFASHRAATAFAAQLAERAGASVIDVLSCSDALTSAGLHGGSAKTRNLRLCTAGSLYVGMAVPVQTNEGYRIEEIVDLERVTAECFDLSVNDAETFYGNGILTHNCLYSFRGARPEHVISFADRWGSTAIYMEENFRSGGDILACGNRVLDAMDGDSKLPMHLKPTRGVPGFVGRMVSDTPITEASALALACAAQKQRGREWRDMAILIRLNAQSKDIELEFFRKKVPLRMISGTSFFSLKEAKTMLGYFRLILGKANEDDLYIAITSPGRYLGKAFVESVARVDNSVGDWVERIPRCDAYAGRAADTARQFVEQIKEWRSSMLRGATPSQLLTRIIEQTQYTQWHVKEQAEGNESSTFVDTMARIRSFTEEFESVESMLTMVDEMRAQQRAAAQSRNAVAVITVHACKGLEWPVTFIPGLTSQHWPVPWGTEREELRCFYVAVTRARDECWISTYARSGNVDDKPIGPSSYLDFVPASEGVPALPPPPPSADPGQLSLI